jgi:hypothetical protein
VDSIITVAVTVGSLYAVVRFMQMFGPRIQRWPGVALALPWMATIGLFVWSLFLRPPAVWFLVICLFGLFLSWAITIRWVQDRKRERTASPTPHA